MTAIVETRALTRRFGSLTAVSGLDMEVARGEIFGLVGPDGAGKTTTVRMLAGLMDPTAGEARVAGYDVARKPQAVRDRIGYMAQRFGLYADLTVSENMAFYADLFGVSARERNQITPRLLGMTRMEPFRDRPAGKLSGGMKQKLALMCTLLHRPEALLLDEPTNGVDPVSRRDFWVILRQLVAEGMTVLVSTSYLDEAERCDRVGLMDRGRLVRVDTPDALRAGLRGRLFETRAGDTRAARERLRGMPGVRSVTTHGSAVHVLMEEGARPAPDLELAPVEPSLEDVFIATVSSDEGREMGDGRRG